MSKLFTLYVFITILFAEYSYAQQTTVFVDNFNRAAVTPGGTPSMTYATTSASGVTVTTNSNTNLRFTSGSTSGINYVTGQSTSYAVPYKSILNTNVGLVTWTFNFRWNRANSNNPAPPASGSYGQAIVLAGSSPTLNGTGNGYAIVYGSSSTPDPIRLVSYSAGINGTLTDIITSGTNNLANTDNYASVKVTYDPTNNNWSLYVRDDGATGWGDPTTVSSQVGTAVANSLYTSTNLTTFGFVYSNAATAGQIGDFDNYAVTINNAFSAGDFRSNATGVWSNLSIWERFDGATWITPAPNSPSSSDGNIYIQNGHSINSDANQTIDQTFVQASGTLVVNAGTTLVIADGTSTDLYIDGTFTATSGTTNVSGQISVNSLTVTSTTGTLNFLTGSTCDMNNFNAVGTPAATWDDNATLSITQVKTGSSGFALTNNTHYGNLYFNYPSQASDVYFTQNTAATLFIDGYFNVVNTNNNKIKLGPGGSGSTFTLTVGGDYTVAATNTMVQALNSSTYTSLTINVGGSISGPITNGSTLGGASGALISTFNLTGTNKTINTSYDFQKWQVVVSGSYTLLQNLAMSTSSPYETMTISGTLDCGTFVISGGSNAAAVFTLASGATLKTANAGGINASIGVFGTAGSKVFAAGANYVFNAATTTAFPTVAQVTNFGNPANVTLNASVTLQRAITVTGTLALQSGTCTNAANLTLGNGATISRSGGTLGSVPTFGTTVNLSYSGSAAITTGVEVPAASTVLNNLEVSTTGTGVSLNSTANLNGALTIGSGAVLTTNNNLNLLSTVSNTARVAEIPVNLSGVALGTVTGSVTVQRFIGPTAGGPNSGAAKSAWRLLTAPLKGTNASIFSTWQDNGNSNAGKGTYVTGPTDDPSDGTNADGLDAITANASMRSFNGTTLDPVTNTKTTLLFQSSVLPGTGTTAFNNSYFVFIDGDRTTGAPRASASTTTLSAVGALQTGNVSFATNPAFDGNTLVGNPYASPIDLQKFSITNAATSKQKNNYYYWDPYTNGTYGYGGYVTVSYADDLGGGQIIAPAGTNHTRFLQSGQAMFLETKSDPSPGPALTGADLVTFTEAHKDATNMQDIFRTSSTVETIAVNLHSASAGTPLLDGIVGAFATTYSAAVDNFDASKFYNIGEGVAFMRNNIALAIERRPTIQLNDTLFLNMKNMVVGNSYSFNFIGDFSSPGMMAFLQDSFNPGVNTPVTVSGNTTYNFTITSNPATQAANRFRIVFRTTGPLPLTLTNVKAYQQNSNIAVEWKTENESRMKQYEVEKSVNGVDFARVNTVAAQNTSAATYNWLDVNAVSGNNYYRIRSISLDGEVKYSKVVKVFIGKGDAVISVYPNPVIDGVINLQLTNMAKGNYTVNLINNIGQVVQSQKVSHTGGSATETISISKSVPRGTYQLEIVSPDNSRITSQLIY